MRPQWFELRNDLVIAGVGILLCLSATKSARAETGPKTLCLKAVEQQSTYREEDVIKALQLRLPDWTVQRKLLQNADGLGGQKCSYLAQVAESSPERMTVSLFSENGTTVAHEEIERKGPAEEVLRRAAITIAMALDLEKEKKTQIKTGEKADKVKEPEPHRALSRTRPYVSVALAPGLSIAPHPGDVAFTGLANAGLLLTSGLWVEVGFKLSSPWKGTSEKGSEISVADRAIALGGNYRIDFPSTWFVFIGLGIRYTHSTTTDLTDGKYQIEDNGLDSRWSLYALGGIGFQFFPFLGVALRLYPEIFSSRRTYQIRGSTAVDLGYFNLAASLGFELYF